MTRFRAGDRVTVALTGGARPRPGVVVAAVPKGTELHAAGWALAPDADPDRGTVTRCPSYWISLDGPDGPLPPFRFDDAPGRSPWRVEPAPPAP